MPERPWTPARIQKLRKRFGETQEQFARRLGVSWVSVSRWENGHVLSPMAKTLLDALERKGR